MRVLAILNPTAGNGRARHLRRRLGELFQAQGIESEIRLTECAGHGTAIAKEAVQEGWDAVVAIGGDGTVHEAVNGLKGTEAPLGIVPLGTGNDFARALGIPKEPEKAIAVIGAAHRRRVDLGEVNGQRYVQVAGVGFDAQVAAAVSKNRERLPGGGVLPYLWGILQQMATYRNRELRLEIDGTSFRQEALMVAIGNTRFYAGGLKICPKARLDDGRLDVCIIGDVPWLGRAGLLVRVFSGAHIQHPKVAYTQAARLRIEGPPDLLVQADGQVIGRLPAELRVLPRALEVFAPPG